MISLNNIEEIIIQEKNNLKNKSKNYKENFSQIKNLLYMKLLKLKNLIKITKT